jgi:hypothetical protein
MKEEEEDSIDKLFSRGLSDPGDNASYREDDWDALEAMLDGKKPKPAGISRNIIYLITTVAAMLLLVIGWAFFKPDSGNNTNQQAGNKKQQVKQDSGKYGSPVQQQEVLASSTLSAGNSNVDSAGSKGRKRRSFFTLSAAPGNRIYTGTKTSIVVPHYTDAATKRDTSPPDPRYTNMANNNIVDQAQPSVSDVNIKRDTSPPDPAKNMAAIRHADSVINGSKKTELVSVVDDIKKPRKTVGTAVSYQPTFAMSIIASPDVNSVGGFTNNRVGTNAGLMLTMGVSKWTISTGAVYADKPYAAPFASYSTAYQFATNPTEVYASCTVLDIPLNIGYQIYNKNRNKFSLGTGLSSYFMLRENYTFDYPGGYGTGGPATYNIRNKNQHIFGVLNLNATYQRDINSRFGLAIQPYMKLPLTGIGYGKVNLRSAGVAVGATWNIISGKKPK